jgi:CrcB protein
MDLAWSQGPGPNRRRLTGPTNLEARATMQGREPAGSDWQRLPVDPDIDVGVSAGARLRVLVAIALGGMIGASARYKLSTWITSPAGGFPWATFWTNVSGSLVLGFLLVVLIERFPPSRYARAFAGTGVLGAYTTFSTFSVETDLLVKDGDVGMAIAYVVASLAVGIALAWFGIALARRVVRA